MHPDVKGSKKSMLERNKMPSQDPEIKKQVDEMGKRWERIGIKFDNQVVSNPISEKQAETIYRITHLINPKTRRSNK
jgi:hypothetical protein